MKVNKIIYFSIAFTVILAATLLNFSIKSPNDGALYYSAADFFLENKFLADPTRTFEDVVRAQLNCYCVLFNISQKYITKLLDYYL